MSVLTYNQFKCPISKKLTKSGISYKKVGNIYITNTFDDIYSLEISGRMPNLLVCVKKYGNLYKSDTTENFNKYIDNKQYV